MLEALRRVVPLVTLCLAACAGAPDAGDEGDELAPDAVNGELSTGSISLTTAISFHGTMMSQGVNVYLIWYGSWSNNTATTILPDFVSHLGGSPWWNINSVYGASTQVTLAGSTTDAYSQGTSLTDAAIASIIGRAHDNGALPYDANGVYFVLGSADVAAVDSNGSWFCTGNCGWHSYTSKSNTTLKYSFVGNADRCPSGCAAQTTSPNGNAGADAMASVMAHELAEAVTDPTFTGWYDQQGYENADKCAWTWGTTYNTSNGAYANMKLGSRDYLIQQNWLPTAGNYCAAYYSAGSILKPGEQLGVWQDRWSADGRFQLVMQADGNLVLYWAGHGALWATGTNGKGAVTASMQGDGNLVLYDGTGHAKWASNTNGHSGAGLTVQNDGNVVIYQNSTALWSSKTCCH